MFRDMKDMMARRCRTRRGRTACRWTGDGVRGFWPRTGGALIHSRGAPAAPAGHEGSETQSCWRPPPKITPVHWTAGREGAPPAHFPLDPYRAIALVSTALSYCLDLDLSSPQRAGRAAASPGREQSSCVADRKKRCRRNCPTHRPARVTLDTYHAACLLSRLVSC
ncbi:hypothetical protein EJ04DRAFT_79674 [Polyplosphaeria fusca]|uniref:Uncharacterized protein n=1 Tax=Polyplosphaeria fusca TaxID=682080 RepID=A0A9P4V2Y9_9PLEO|nr:hypothetical protein EJ04DRAFT_79674 [Polyplosphaeria fusca]